MEWAKRAESERTVDDDGSTCILSKYHVLYLIDVHCPAKRLVMLNPDGYVLTLCVEFSSQNIQLISPLLDTKHCGEVKLKGCS